MQVNNVQNSPNFGMGMIIEKGARPAIKMATDAQLKEISKYGEVAYKCLDRMEVRLREGLDAVIRDKKTGKEIRGPFEAVFEPKNGILTVVAKEADPHSTSGIWDRVLFQKLYFRNTKEAKAAMETLQKTEGLAAAVEYARMAEQSAKLCEAHPIVTGRGFPIKGSIYEIIAKLGRN